MRSKLRLEVEQLAVESFDTAADGRARGTVAGHQSATDFCSDECTLQYSACGPDTCLYSCGGTCGSYTCYLCNATVACGTAFDATCRGYGTCGVGQYPCADIP